MMDKLYKSNNDKFVRPYALLEGSQGQILPHAPWDEQRCGDSVCIVMERGTIDMQEFLVKHPDISRTDKLSRVEKMVRTVPHFVSLSLAPFFLCFP